MVDTSVPVETKAQITRGVNILVKDAKRGPEGFVFLSLKRTSELAALKTSPFYQGLTLVDSREDKVVFRTKLSSIHERFDFIKQATEAAHEVGVGTSEEIENTITTKTKSKAKTA